MATATAGILMAVVDWKYSPDYYDIVQNTLRLGLLRADVVAGPKGSSFDYKDGSTCQKVGIAATVFLSISLVSLLGALLEALVLQVLKKMKATKWYLGLATTLLNAMAFVGYVVTMASWYGACFSGLEDDFSSGGAKNWKQSLAAEGLSVLLMSAIISGAALVLSAISFVKNRNVVPNNMDDASRRPMLDSDGKDAKDGHKVMELPETVVMTGNSTQNAPTQEPKLSLHVRESGCVIVCCS